MSIGEILTATDRHLQQACYLARKLVYRRRSHQRCISRGFLCREGSRWSPSQTRRTGTRREMGLKLLKQWKGQTICIQLPTQTILLETSYTMRLESTILQKSLAPYAITQRRMALVYRRILEHDHYLSTNTTSHSFYKDRNFFLAKHGSLEKGRSGARFAFIHP